MGHFHFRLLLTVITLSSIHCDFPSHCLKSQVEGVWKITHTLPKRLGDPSFNSCGHEIPSNEVSSQNLTIKKYRDCLQNPNCSPQWRFHKKKYFVLSEFGFVDKARRLKKFGRNFIDESVFTDVRENVNNFWTMVYDEGFEIRHDEYNFFSFFEWQKYQAMHMTMSSTTYCDR